MLTFLNVTHPDQIKNILQDYPVEKYTWIVSDLKSKFDLQQLSLQKKGYYSEDECLRISDFWNIWFRRLLPDFQLISSEAMQILVEEIYLQNTDRFFFTRHQLPTLFHYLDYLFPLFASEQHQQLMDWFVETNANNQEHPWYKWYLSALFFYQQIILKKIALPQWQASLLLTQDLSVLNLNRPLVLDLGSEMTSIEMTVFKLLSQKVDVYLIHPQPEWKDRYHFLLNTYQNNLGYGKSISVPNVASSPTLQPVQFKRFATEMTEVQWIVTQVRKWLDQGVPAYQIGLFSARLEEYWPQLAMYFKVEGIPVQKQIVGSYLSKGFFQSLNAQLKSLSSQVSWESLEMAYAADQGITSLISFEKFKALFLELTEVEELGRHDQIKELYQRKIDLSKKISRDEFLTILLMESIKISDDPEFLNDLSGLFKEIMAQSLDEKWSFESWFKLWTTRLAKKEFKIEEAAQEGVQLRALGAVYLTNITHRIWYGLDESSFQSSKGVLIPLSDVEVLKRIFDFPMNYPEESHDEFNLRWLSVASCDESFFSCAHVSMKAEPLTTSLFFLENNPKPDDLEFRDQTRWGALQKNYQISQSSKLSWDLDLTTKPALNFKPTEISVHDLMSLAECEFKLLAAKGFRLRDESVVSIELDPLQKGTVIHGLFEYLIKEQKYQTVQPEEIEIFLEDFRLKNNLFPKEDLFWKLQKTKFLAIGIKFAEREKKRLAHSSIEFILEKSFEFKYDFLTLRGRIDRIDLDVKSQSYLIYDYKRSDSSYLNYADKWISEKEYQLLVYVMALIQEGISAQQIKGALYYFYQKFQIYKGGYWQDADSADSTCFAHQIDFKKKTTQSPQDLIQLIQKFEEELKVLLAQISEQKFWAIPKNTDDCADCDWRKLCRAPHLN